jgi:hypothetical protein
MIAKGVTHGQGARLARYLITGKDRERAELLELRGFALEGIVDAFRSVQLMARATKCVLPFFHVSVRNRDSENLDAEQWRYAADTIERSLGLSDQPRAIAFHTCLETGDSHMHIAWSRIDEDSLTAKPLPFYKERLKRVCRELEQRFGLAEVSSVRKGKIAYAPTRKEEEQSRRLSVDLRDHRETIRACFERSDCGRSFQRSLKEQGLVLARGERRDFLAIDRAGGIHALGKRILGVSAAQLRGRLADLIHDGLPTVEEVRDSLRKANTQSAVPIDAPIPLQQIAEAEQAEDVTVSDGIASTVDALPTMTPELAVEQSGPKSASVSATASKTTASRGQSGGLSAILKQHFRAAVRVVFRRAPMLSPQARRRKSGETVSLFRLAARRLLKPIVRLPVIKPLLGLLHDTLPWLHLWEWNEPREHDPTSYDMSDDYPAPHP